MFCHSIAGRWCQNMPLLWKCVCLNSLFICDVASPVKHTLFSHEKQRQDRVLLSTKPVMVLYKSCTWPRAFSGGFSPFPALSTGKTSNWKSNPKKREHKTFPSAVILKSLHMQWGCKEGRILSSVNVNQQFLEKQWRNCTSCLNYSAYSNYSSFTLFPSLLFTMHRGDRGLE